MKIKLNKKNRIIGYAYVGDLENSIEVKENIAFDNESIYLYENEKIIEKKKPTNFIKPIFDDDLKEWVEGMTKEELMLKRKDLIMKFKQIKIEIETLEEFESEFESEQTIALLREKLLTTKKEINELGEKIKKMK